MRLNIITPLSRPENLPALYSRIGWFKQIDVDVMWWVVVDPVCLNECKREYDICLGNDHHVTQLIAERSALAGHAHRNLILDLIKNESDWIMSLDDDNMIHGGLLRWLKKNQNQLSEYSGLLFDQVHKNGSLRLIADPEKVCVNNVDTAQFMFRRGIIEDLRFKEDEYAADGLFIQELYARHKDKFLIVNEPLCYYNYLR